MPKRPKPTAKRRTTTQGPPDEHDDYLLGDSQLYVKHLPTPLFAPPDLIVETVYFSKVGHTFGAHPLQSGVYLVQDFLLDQTGASGADGKMSGTTTFDLTTVTIFRFNVFPKDRARRIKVLPPPSVQASMWFNVGRRYVNAVSDVADGYAATTIFFDLSGTPMLTNSSFSIGKNTNHWIQFRAAANVSLMSFSGFSIIGTYPMRTFDPGIKSYIPFSTSLPFNLPGPNSVPNMMFTYTTTSSSDPGPFVFI